MLCKPLREFSHPRGWFRGQNSDLKTITFKEFRDLQDSFLLSIDIKTLPAGGDSYTKRTGGEGSSEILKRTPHFYIPLQGVTPLQTQRSLSSVENGLHSPRMVLQRTISKTCAQLNVRRKCRAIVLLMWNIFSAGFCCHRHRGFCELYLFNFCLSSTVFLFQPSHVAKRVYE